jgi:hypothetical protein
MPSRVRVQAHSLPSVASELTMYGICLQSPQVPHRRQSSPPVIATKVRLRPRRPTSPPHLDTTVRLSVLAAPPRRPTSPLRPRSPTSPPRFASQSSPPHLAEPPRRCTDRHSGGPNLWRLRHRALTGGCSVSRFLPASTLLHVRTAPTPVGKVTTLLHVRTAPTPASACHGDLTIFLH